MGSLSVGVFCGARDGGSAALRGLAHEVGALLAGRGHSLVYGGGGTGVMGAVAHAAARGGAKVTGVIPRFLYDRERGDNAPVQDMIITDDMFARKREMFARMDVVLAMPGGFGTLDEVLEAVSLSYLGLAVRPIVLLDEDGYWTNLIAVLDDVTAHGFAAPVHEPLIHLAHDPVSAIDLLESM